MTRYIGLIDGEVGAYGIVFSDLPGCVSMGGDGRTVVNGIEATKLWSETTGSEGREIPVPQAFESLRDDPDVRMALEDGARIVTVPLVRATRRSVKANLSIDSGILGAIDAEAARFKLTRSGLIEALARDGLHKLA